MIQLNLIQQLSLTFTFALLLLLLLPAVQLVTRKNKIKELMKAAIKW